MVKTVFLSRDISGESPIKQLLRSDAYKVFGESLIEFTPLEFGPLPSVSWIFFYSPRGVRFFFNNVPEEFIFLNYKYGTIGAGTAKCLKNYIPKVHFIGTGAPEETAIAFRKIVSEQRVLFIRALKSKKSIQNLLDKHVTIFDLAVYKNEIKQHFELPSIDYAVLTSSMNAEAYFGNYPWNYAKHIIAIGQPTAKTIYALTGKMPYLPINPSEQAIAELILELEEKNNPI